MLILYSNNYFYINMSHAIFETYLLILKKTCFWFIGNSYLTGCPVFCQGVLISWDIVFATWILLYKSMDQPFVLCSGGVIDIEYNENGCPLVELCVPNIF